MRRLRPRSSKLRMVRAPNVAKCRAASDTFLGPLSLQFNPSGLPAITPPLHTSRGGLPIGMMFGVGFGKEATLFRLAGQLERAMPWADRHPRHSLWTSPQ
jgi:Asp-tRNA(Asn)/Glu-tRNA(Gln) amidotransferase A subunit family amidase